MATLRIQLRAPTAAPRPEGRHAAPAVRRAAPATIRFDASDVRATMKLPSNMPHRGARVGAETIRMVVTQSPNGPIVTPPPASEMPSGRGAIPLGPTPVRPQGPGNTLVVPAVTPRGTMIANASAMQLRQAFGPGRAQAGGRETHGDADDENAWFRSYSPPAASPVDDFADLMDDDARAARRRGLGLPALLPRVSFHTKTVLGLTGRMFSWILTTLAVLLGGCAFVFAAIDDPMVDRRGVPVTMITIGLALAFAGTAMLLRRVSVAKPPRMTRVRA